MFIKIVCNPGKVNLVPIFQGRHNMININTCNLLGYLLIICSYHCTSTNADRTLREGPTPYSNMFLKCLANCTHCRERMSTERILNKFKTNILNKYVTLVAVKKTNGLHSTFQL